jgi:hypothetical protein
MDVAGGHGLLAYAMLLLDDSSPEACIIDPAVPSSGGALHDAFVAEWPRLRGRATVVGTDIRNVPLDSTDLVVSSHACGALTDLVLDAAVSATARVAVLPCCHDLRHSDARPLRGWLDGPMAIDAMRAARMVSAGYDVRTQTISASITPKNRLLIAVPRARPGEPPARS